MTDQTPDPDTVRDAWTDVVTAFRPVWESMKTAFEVTQDEFVLVPNPDVDDVIAAEIDAAQDEYDVETRLAARRAIAAAIDQDDDAARTALVGLDAEQLQQVENAAVALSLQASRHRKAADQSQEGDR